MTMHHSWSVLCGESSIYRKKPWRALAYAEPVARQRDSNQIELEHAGFQKLLQRGGVWEMVKVLT